MTAAPALPIVVASAIMIAASAILGFRMYFRSTRVAPERALRTLALAALQALFAALATGLLGILLSDPTAITYGVLRVFTGMDLLYVDGPSLFAVVLVTFLLVAVLLYACHEVAVHSRPFRRFLRGKPPRP
jgi:hypothetical protein